MVFGYNQVTHTRSIHIKQHVNHSSAYNQTLHTQATTIPTQRQHEHMGPCFAHLAEPLTDPVPVHSAELDV